MRGFGKVIAAFFIAVAAGGMIAGSADAAEIVRVGGAGSALGGMRLLGRAYEATHPGVKIQVFASLGSSGGIKALLAGSLDLAVSGRQLKPAEHAAGASSREYAKSPFVFVANRSVTSKSDLSTKDLERMYAGQMLKWPDGSQIRLVLRPDSDTDTKIIKAISPALAEAARTAASRPGMIYAVTDQDCDEAVMKTVGAVGPSTLTEIITEKRAVHVFSFNGVKPSVKAVAAGKYPLVKPHYIITTARSSAAAQGFADFVTSARGRAILAKVGNLVAEANGR